MEVSSNYQTEQQVQDADQNYHQSSAEVQIVYYVAMNWVEGALVPNLGVDIEANLNSRPVCCGCVQPEWDKTHCRNGTQ